MFVVEEKRLNGLLGLKVQKKSNFKGSFLSNFQVFHIVWLQHQQDTDLWRFLFRFLKIL